MRPGSVSAEVDGIMDEVRYAAGPPASYAEYEAPWDRGLETGTCGDREATDPWLKPLRVWFS